MNSLKRNSCIDTIKGFACIAVVLIHYNWSGYLGAVIKTVSRFAVPYFFFVSGYYLPNSSLEITRASVKRKAGHILKLLLKSGAVYLVFCIVWNILMDRSWNIVAFIREEVFPSSIVKFVISNDPFVYAHFWYMLALVYNYGMMYLLGDKLRDKTYLAVGAVLMIGYSLIAEFNSYTGLRNGIPLWAEGSVLYISNTFVFRGLPCFLLGIYFRKSGAGRTGKAGIPVLVLVALLGGVLACVETLRKQSLLMYVGTYVTVIALIVLSVRYPDWSIKPMEYIGNKLSMHIYIYHIAVGKVVDLIAAKRNLWDNKLFSLSKPVLVVLGSIGFAWLIGTITEKRKTRIKT